MTALTRGLEPSAEIRGCLEALIGGQQRKPVRARRGCAPDLRSFDGTPTLPGLMTSPLSYIDPGSGSLFLQAMAGGVAAVAVVGKVYWRRVKRLLHIGKPEDEGSPS